MDRPEFSTANYFIAFAVFLPIAVLYYRHKRKNDGYWEEKGIPFEPRRAWYSIIRDYSVKDFCDFEMERYQKYGRIYGYFEGEKPNLTVCDPDVLRDILVKDFQSFTFRRVFDFVEPVFSNTVVNMNGEEWKRVRTIVSPAFSSGRMRKMALIINDCTKVLVNNLIKCADSGIPADCKKLFGAFTMDVTASSAFGTKINSHESPENPFVVHARNTFSKNAALKTIAFFLLPSFLRKLLGLYFLDQNSIDFFRSVTLQVIEERRKTGQKGNDFLQLMMDAYKEELEAANKVEEFTVMELEDEDEDKYGANEITKNIFKTIYQNKSLSHDELLSQCVLFFIVGYETSAATLTFLAYNLACNPEVQEKLIQEIDSVVEKSEQLSYDLIGEMKYLDRVVSETLRLQPPVIRAERTAVENYKIKNSDITVTKGMIVGFCIYAMHHDPEFYPEPEKFDPDRFLPENANHPAYAYLPFGAGPRHCLGMRFALMEIKLCIANALRSVRFRTCPETKIPMEVMMAQGFLTPKNLVLAVEKRTDVPLVSKK